MGDWKKVEAQLRKTINDINVVTEGNDTNIVDGVDRLIRGYGQGSELKLQDKTITENGTYQADNGYDGLGSVTVEVASGGGIDGGYNVTFYDEYDEELALYSVRRGLSVDKPDYACKAWITQYGDSIEFPYMPTEDMSFYASNDTYEKILYEYYGVDRAIYPYMFIENNSWEFNIAFGKTLGSSGTDKSLQGGTLYKTTTKIATDLCTLDYMVEYAMNNIGSVKTTTSNQTVYDSAGRYYATNFNVTLSNATLVGKLD